MVIEVELDNPPGVEANPEVALGVDLLHHSWLAVGNPVLPERGRELNPIAGSDLSLFAAIDVHALQALRVVSHRCAIGSLHRDLVIREVYSSDIGILPLAKAKLLASSGVAHHIPDLVARRPLAIGAGELLPIG